MFVLGVFVQTVSFTHFYTYKTLKDYFLDNSFKGPSLNNVEDVFFHVPLDDTQSLQKYTYQVLQQAAAEAITASGLKSFQTKTLGFFSRSL